MNFNGTAGMWRTSCIKDAGGWHTGTLVEDLDLSDRSLRLKVGSHCFLKILWYKQRAPGPDEWQQNDSRTDGLKDPCKLPISCSAMLSYRELCLWIRILKRLFRPY